MRPSHRKHNRQWVGGPKAWRRAASTTVSSAELLKELWPQHNLSGGPIWERSWAAKLARDRHWITWAQYFAFPIENTGRVAPSMFGIYDESPFFKLFKKDTTWGASA